MPVINQSGYQNNAFWLWNGHVQTIYPALFRQIQLSYHPQNERITTIDLDFIDLDWYEPHTSENLVIISHGLEGDSKRPYMLGMTKQFLQKGWNVLCWNYRSCSGEINKQKRFYHLGATDDLDWVIQHALQKVQYKKLYLIGFSAGGNLTLKYLGEKNTHLNPIIQKAVVFSAPCDLSAGAQHLKRWQNRIYERRFLKTLKQKVKNKAIFMPQAFDLTKLDEAVHIWDFDEHYTAPIHNFKGAEDYYAHCSSKFFLKDIQIPTLIVSAQNDPFLAKACYPLNEVKNLANVFLEIPETGGHCGFYLPQETYWSEERAWEFLNL